MMTHSLKVQDTLHNAVMSTRPSVVAKATLATNKDKEARVGELLDHQFFVEGKGENIVGEMADAFVNDGVMTVFTPWVKEEREVHEMHTLAPIPKDKTPEIHFDTHLRVAYPNALFKKRDADGWSWEVYDQKKREWFDVEFYTVGDAVEMDAQRRAVVSEALLAGKGDVWDSGRVASGESLLVPYGGPALEPARAYSWRVRVEDAGGRLSGWSAPGRFVTALASPADWGEARWIGYADMPMAERVVPGIHGLLDPNVHPRIKHPVVPLLRRVFAVRKPVARALLFVSGLGHYEAYLNGARVGDRFLAPGWTDYDATVLYDAFDVTGSLGPGENAIAAVVGNGFHHVAPERYYKLAIAYGWPKLLAALLATSLV